MHLQSVWSAAKLKQAVVFNFELFCRREKLPCLLFVPVVVTAVRVLAGALSSTLRHPSGVNELFLTGAGPNFDGILARL